MKGISIEKETARIRREQEIKEHGKQIWMRKCHVFDDEKAYNRKAEKRKLTRLLETI